MLKSLLLAGAAALALGPGDAGGTHGLPACDRNAGLCCCTLASGLQCCGEAGACGTGVVPGCACTGNG